TAVNGSAADVDNVVVSDDLSDVLAHAAFKEFVDDDDGNASISGDDLTWDAGTLEAGETRSVSYTVTVDEDARGVSFGNVVIGEGDIPPTDCTPIEPCETTHFTPATWTLSKDSDPGSGSKVAPGDTVTYTVTAENTSAADVDHVSVSDDLSDVLAHASFDRFVDDNDGNATLSGNDLTWNAGTLEAG